MIFKDRLEAGDLLAQKLKEVTSRLNLDPTQVIILGIPRGGVVAAAQVARKLEAPLDTVVVRKLGVPGHEEFAFGAVGVSGEVTLDETTVSRLGLSGETIESVRQKEWREAQRREALFRGQKGPLELAGKTAILVDDGIATGATTEAAVKSAKGLNPKKIILAVPVAPADTVLKLKSLVDETVVLFSPLNFMAVGQFYAHFPQTSDEEVKGLLSSKQ